MVNILSIETATSRCSVAVHADGELISLLEIAEPGAHAEKLMLLIDAAVEKAGLHLKDMNAIAVSAGPGSYTGLRIGVSTAKGLAFGLGKPLIGIGTLHALASALVLSDGDFVIPMLDARRMEVYLEVFDWKLNSVEELRSEILSEDSFQNFLKKGRVYFVGDAVDKLKTLVWNENAEFVTDLSFSAKYMGKISFEKYQKRDFADIAYFVPNYLKEFKALHSKKNPLLSS
jgi:tRNA threonylcarbamoyladenosine biosynthesis protein TsaB